MGLGRRISFASDLGAGAITSIVGTVCKPSNGNPHQVLNRSELA